MWNTWEVDITTLCNQDMAKQGQGKASVTPSFSTALNQHELHNSFLPAFTILAEPVLLQGQIQLNSHSTS